MLRLALDQSTNANSLTGGPCGTSAHVDAALAEIRRFLGMHRDAAICRLANRVHGNIVYYGFQGKNNNGYYLHACMFESLETIDVDNANSRDLMGKKRTRIWRNNSDPCAGSSANYNKISWSVHLFKGLSAVDSK